jgi:hypothetical protein
MYLCVSRIQPAPLALQVCSRQPPQAQTYQLRLVLSQGLSCTDLRSTFSRHTGQVSFLPTMVQPRTHSSWKQCLQLSCTHRSAVDCTQQHTMFCWLS